MKNSVFMEYTLLLSSVAGAAGTMALVASLLSKYFEIQFVELLAALV